jgi:hypothetical protein
MMAKAALAAMAQHPEWARTAAVDVKVSRIFVM